MFALGVVALTLSAFILPEQLYPWLNLASGLLVVGVGARRAALALRGDGGVTTTITTTTTRRRSPPRGILAMGASAGLIPCPSALVVLLGAVAQHQLALGLVMIVAFSLGLAATLTALGIAVVHADEAAGARPRRPPRCRPRARSRSSCVGVVLTVQAAGQFA